MNFKVNPENSVDSNVEATYFSVQKRVNTVCIFCGSLSQLLGPADPMMAD